MNSLETGTARQQDAVALHAVSKVYGSSRGTQVAALRAVSVGFPPGTFTAIMGPSGSGKSTLLQCAAGLDRPTSGTVHVAGHDLGSLNESKLTELRRDRIGFVFQSFNLLPSLTAELNVALPLRLAGRRPRRGQVRAALDSVGLGDRARHRPAELSGGQQQRVAIARALIAQPDVVFADEPTGALDTASGRQVLGLLRALADRQGQTVIMVTHDPVAASYADRVVFLADGVVRGDLPGPTPQSVAARMTDLESGLRPRPPPSLDVPTLAWRTARARAASLAGMFVALALGVTLVSAVLFTLVATAATANPPRWFTTPDVVIAGQNSVTVVSGGGDDREVSTVRTTESRAVPAGLVRPLSALGAASVTDYAAPASVPGAPGDTLHPWAAAALHRYSWVAGGPPRSAGQLVLTAPTSLKPGTRVTAQTAAGPRRFTVSGVIATAAPPASYAAGPVAARLAGGRVDAVALTARPGTTPAALAARAAALTRGQAVQVLTGDRRANAEPDPDSDLLSATAALLGVTAGLAGFISVFVVAGTFAYAVAVRRREFGLLRTAGAKPRQVRRLVLGEALAVGVLASLAGCVLGTVIAAPGARWLARVGFAPAGFTARFIWWPAAIAFGAGLLIALAGAWLASRRAARVRPAEALREAAVDTRVMPLLRWLTGLAALGGSVPLMMILGNSHSVDTAALFLPISVLLTLGFAMLTPVLARPLIRLVTPALAGLAGAPGLLAAHGAAAGVRRTAATVAPILLTIGIAGSLAAGVESLEATQAAATASRVSAQAMVTPAGGAGLADATVAALAKAPGVTAAVPVTETTVYVPGDGDAPEPWDAQYVPGPSLAAVRRVPVTAGSLAALTGTGTVAVPAGSGRVGQVITVWLADSAPAHLRVVAVFADQVDTDETMLLPWALRAGHTAAPVASLVYLRLAPGAAAPAAVAAAGGGRVTGTSGYLSAADAENNRLNKLALVAILGLAIAYTGIAIANTLVMANAARKREFATLRLSGASRGQVLRMIAIEACLVTGVAVVLAGGIIAASVLGLRGGLAASAPAVHVVVPWLPITLIALGALVIALLASLAPAALALRRRPVELARALE